MQDRSKRSVVTKLQTPGFKREADEARWYEKNQDLLLAEFKDAALRREARKGRIVADPVTGLPVLSAGDDVLTLNSADVDEILADFP